MSGFGQTGPDRRRAGVNLIIEAFSGALSVTGEPGKMPMRPGVQTADVFGALFVTYATLRGLGGRRAQRRRPHRRCLAGGGIDRARRPGRRRSISRPARCRSRSGNRHRLNAPYQLFETSDGRYLAIGTPNDALFGRLMQVLGLEAHVSDPRFPSYAKRKANEDALLPLVEPAVRVRESADLEQALRVAGVPCAA